MRSNINILQREYEVDAKRAGNSKKLRKSFFYFILLLFMGERSPQDKPIF